MVFFEGRHHICDGGLNCAASKGTQRRAVKTIVSDFVQKRTHNLASSLCCERSEEWVFNLASSEEFFPTCKLTGLLSPRCVRDSVVDVNPCKIDFIQAIVSFSSL